ncbi:MAG: hypothetical protein ACYC61_19420 [Isosphaeraceae bacterium]
MELREALTQITEIRLQLARTEVFRGYRAMPVAFSGVVALIAGLIQAATIAAPGEQIGPYLALWIGAAAVSALAAVVEMLIRARIAGSRLTRELTWLALEQFCPSLIAGALLTIVLVRVAPESVWMLPGLWQIVFSLGIFASCRLLPRATWWVGVFYLAAGLSVLTLARGDAALSPWAMAVPFGAGQGLAAAVLYATLERDHAADSQ